MHEVALSTLEGNPRCYFGLGWRSGREPIIPLVALVDAARETATWTVEAADILLLGRSERDKRGRRHRGGGRIGPGVGTKRGGRPGAIEADIVHFGCSFCSDSDTLIIEAIPILGF